MTPHLISFEAAHNDLLDCAAYLAEEIADAELRGEAFEKIVPYYLERGAVDLAAELANTIDFAPRREMLLSNIAVKCAEIKDDDYALQLVEAIADPQTKDAALERVIIEIADQGNLDKVLPLARQLSSSSVALGLIAVKRNARGEEEDALQMIENIQDAEDAAGVLCAVALAKYAAGEPERAAELLEDAHRCVPEVNYVESKIITLHTISAAFVEIERRDRAFDVLSEIQRIAETLGAVDRDNRLSEVSLAFFEAGSIDLADRALDLVQDKTQIASVLIGFARVYWDKNERSDALESLREAGSILRRQTIYDTRNSLLRFQIMNAAAAQFAEFGELESALEIADHIEMDGERNSALTKIAQILSIQHKNDDAGRILNLINDENVRIEALLAVADAHYRDENLPQAVKYTDEAANGEASSAKDFSRRKSAVAIANRYAVFGAVEKAHQTAAEILRETAKLRDPADQTSVLANLSGGFEQANLKLNQVEKDLLKKILDY